MASRHLRRQGSVDHDDSSPCSRSSTSSLTQTMTSSSGCDVVKKGSLYVKKFPNRKAVSISIKTWNKRFLVLRDDWTHSGKTTLDIYERESDSSDVVPSLLSPPSPSLFFSSSCPSPPLVIDLRSVVSVDLYLESRSFVHALVVDRTDGHPVILGAESDHEMRCWLAAIKLLADKANRLVPSPGGGLLGDGRPATPNGPSLSSSEDGVVMPRKGSQSLKAKINRKTPQLFKFARGPTTTTTTTRHLSIDRELSPSKSFGSKWFSSSLSIRKDSGFSESFDESLEQFQSTYCPPQDTVQEDDDDDDDYVNNGPSTPPPPPIPPRQACGGGGGGSPFAASSPRTPLLHEPWFASDAPLPPPRPRHTLSVTSW